MRKPLLLLACVVIVAVGAVALAMLPSDSESDGGSVGAQDDARAPIFASEVYQWCTDSCNGGNDQFEPNAPASFTPREDGSLHFVTNVNYSACPSMTIPEDVEGWYFGTSREQIANAQATAEANSEVVKWETTGVLTIDGDMRNNPDLMICEAIFVRGG